jgi:NAD-dependent deacetylase
MKKLVVFSGAGMSAESGLGTFRDSGGLWEKYAIEDVATPEAWRKNPTLVTEFYNMRRKQAYEATPNRGHEVVAELERHFDVQVITQNIDNLHERSGSTRVIHLHGNIAQVKSSGPNAEKKYYDQQHWEVKIGELCPEGYQLRPHVVWFGEAVPEMMNAEQIVRQADIFIVVGTSLNVYPAAGLIHDVPPGCACYLVDPHPVSIPDRFIHLQHSASLGLPLLYTQLLEEFVHKNP